MDGYTVVGENKFYGNVIVRYRGTVCVMTKEEYNSIIKGEWKALRIKNKKNIEKLKKLA